MQKRGYHDFPLKFFCITVPKNFVGESFCVPENFWYRKFSCIRGEGASRFSVVLIKLKDEGKGWDSNLYLPLQNPAVLPTVGTIGISDKCEWNHKNLWPNRDSNPDLLFEKCFSLLQCRDHLFESKNSWQKYTDKKTNDPTTLNV